MDSILAMTDGLVSVGSLEKVQARVDANIAGISEGSAACQTGHVEDVDIAKAMADYTKDNILQQSPQAMMAQETPPWSQYLG